MKKQSQLSNQIRKLQYQLSYSEHINKQLGQELKAYQQKNGLSHTTRAFKFDENINSMNTHVHLQELYYVEPLFLAYQNKIQFIQTKLLQCEQQAKDLNQFAKEMVQQNNFLRNELQSKNQYILKSEQISLNSNFIKLDNDNLQSTIEILKQKNKTLQNHLQSLQDEQYKLKKQHKNLANKNEMGDLLDKVKQQRRQFEVKCLQLQKKNQLTSNRLQNQLSINSDLKNKIAQLQNQILKHKNQNKILQQQYNTYKVTHENNYETISTELSTLKTQLNQTQRKEQELFNKSMILQSQIQDKNNKLHNMSLQSAQLQSNNNSMLQMLQSYEVKVTNLNKKNKTLENQLKDHLQSVISDKKTQDVLEWKLNQKQSELEKRQIEWKKQKQRVGKMWEDRIQALRKTLSNEINSLYDEINVLKSEKAQLEARVR